MDSTAISGSWIRTWTWRVRTPKIWCGWNDLFHEDVPFEYALQAFDRMDQTPHHLFLVLTKGPERMEEFWTKYFFSVLLSLRRLAEGWANNVWAGITAESQERFDKRWPILEQVPSLYKLISYEPALGPLRLPDDFLAQESRGIMICGGETGKGARPMHPDWPRAVRDQCLAHGANFFFKGWGGWIAEVPADNYPSDSRIRNGGVAGARCEHGYIYRRRRHDGMVFRYLDGQLWEGWPE